MFKKENIKYFILIIIGVIVISLIIPLNSSKTTYVCTKTTSDKNFEVKDEITIYTKKYKISGFEVNKEVTIKSKKDYGFKDPVVKTIKNAYSYLSDKEFSYEVSKDKKIITANIKTNEKGIVLNNVNISKNENSTNDHDYSFNAVVFTETSDQALNINDDVKGMKNKIEGNGYTCK